MGMRWVQRHNGAIMGSFANRQPGYADEEIDEEAPEHVAFRDRVLPARRSDTEAAMLKGFTALVEKGVVTKGDLPKELSDILDSAIPVDFTRP